MGAGRPGRRGKHFKQIMFSYYGSKSKLAHLYPRPKHHLIIEPFAGSARYALEHWENDVILCDLSDYVVEVWRYLLAASKKDIMGLPNVPSKVHIDNFPGLTGAERYLIGFHLCRGKAKPRKTGHGQNSWARDKERIARNLHKIKHWRIEQKSYTEIENVLATYFIDPPYMVTQNRPSNSDRYEHGGLDYTALAEWIRSRRGLVIACEGTSVDYLPFKLLTTANTNTNNRAAKTVGEYCFVQDGADG